MKIKKLFGDKFEELLLTICLLLILSVSFVQVIIRKIPGVSALTWAEEFCRFLWICSVFLSLPYCLKKGSMLKVGLLASSLGERVRRIIEYAVDFINFAVMTCLSIVSIGVVLARFESGELSPAMLLPMWILYGFMLFCYILASVRGAQKLIADFKRNGGEG